MQRFDAIIIGAGAAGLHCAGIAGQRGLRVLLIDHADKVAEKIRISGGGRCNFTNLGTSPAQFASDNPQFTRSALARYSPQDFIDLLRTHGVGFHEKHKGQLFCDGSSQQVIDVLLTECGRGSVAHWQPCSVLSVRQDAAGYSVDTSRGSVHAAQLVVATGGLSIPKIGATDFAHTLARQFGLGVTETRPALVPLTFGAADWAPFVPLAGASLPVVIRVATPAQLPRSGGISPPARPGRRGGGSTVSFAEDILFTHRGLSGPAVLQISNYWKPGNALQIALAPGVDVVAALLAAKRSPQRHLPAALASIVPRRLADTWSGSHAAPALLAKPLADWPDRALRDLGQRLNDWQVLPDGTEGYRKAEVTLGGVDTRELDSATMQSRRHPGLHFIGEAVDVTGWLGGYNFQWAWASAAACARALAAVAAPA